TSTGTRQAHLDGFDLHANVHVAANNRDGLEQLARYVPRPPIAQDRLTRTADGRVLLTLKTEWSDGTTALLFASVELLQRLAALAPAPRINLDLPPAGGHSRCGREPTWRESEWGSRRRGTGHADGSAGRSRRSSRPRSSPWCAGANGHCQQSAASSS